jgi:hypothetical protein
MPPLRRTEDLSVKPLEGELLIYDLKADKAHSLNSVAALVYRLADGTLGAAGLAQHVAEQLGVAPAEANAMTEMALEQLSQRGLLVDIVERARGEARMSRRKVLQSLAVAAVAVPVIVSLSAPWPVVHASCARQGTSCTLTDCCQGLTCVNSGGQLLCSS